MCKHEQKKSSIRETKHLSTDADSSTDTGYLNTQKPKLFEKRKNHPKRKNLKTSRNMPKAAICPSTRHPAPCRAMQGLPV